MNCPKCGSDQTYRKHPLDLTVWCDRCGYSFTDSQPQKPIFSTQAYRKSAPRGTHRVSVPCCKCDSSKYSFSITFGGGIAHKGEYASKDYPGGCYSTPGEALGAGVKWVRGRRYSWIKQDNLQKRLSVMSQRMIQYKAVLFCQGLLQGEQS